MKSVSLLSFAAAALFGLVLSCTSDPSTSDAFEPSESTFDAVAETDAAAGVSRSDGGRDDATATGLVWPNHASYATSDPWLVVHHDVITEMRPRVLAINFDNDPTTRNNWKKHVEQLIAGFAEGSRYHGYSDPTAKPFLKYEVSKWVDLADETPPAGWPHKYSTKLPVNCNSTAFYQFDYAALFEEKMAAAFGAPLCELFARGEVHEVWLHANGDPSPYTCPDGKVLDTVGIAEILEAKPKYDASGRKTGEFERCAGNGCLAPRDFEAFKACGRTVRVLYINSTRGPGCAMHSAGHGYEWMARSGAVPELKPRFMEFANFDLDTRLGLPFRDWYTCDAPDCLTFTGPNSVNWKVRDMSGSIPELDQGCGNVHFAPNARGHYDENDFEVLSRCEHFGLRDGENGKDEVESFSRAKYARYRTLAPDCGGAWQVYWRQSFPGFGNRAKDSSGRPMRNWWPYIFW